MTTVDVITNDDQLGEAVSEAGRLLQEIQDYLKRDLKREGKVRFPRGFIRAADDYRKSIAPFIHLCGVEQSEFDHYERGMYRK